MYRLCRTGLRLQTLKKEGCAVCIVPQHRSFSVSPQNAKVPPSMPATASMPDTDFKPAEYKGMSYEEARKVRTSTINPAILEYYKQPIMLHQGHMQWLFDQNGKRYLDLFAGIVTVSVGHCHPKVNKALHEQIDKIWHTTNVYMIPAIYEYAEMLTSKMPGNLKNVYFVNSGTEANDLAVNLARLHTGAYDIVSLRNAYHGISPTLLGLTCLGNWLYDIPGGFGYHNAINPDPFRGPWGGKNCRDSPVQTIRQCDCAAGQCHAKDMYIDQLKDLLRYETPKKIAGMFAESIQGVGGAVQFPKGYLKEAFELIREKGGVCISDEVQTGFGRTGEHYWGFEAQGVLPDIVTLAKGIGNGFPLAAVVTTPDIAASLTRALHISTYGGGPLAGAVGKAVLEVIEEEGTQANCKEVGTYTLLELAKLRDDFEIVGDVRGKGLMIGVEMVTDKESRRPLPPEQMGAIWEDMKEMGVLIGKGGIHGNVFRIKPPMIVTKEDMDFGLSILKKALQNHMERHS
ncbi:alanine--glyoxylate aminotransferase 2, mitochondrial-like [Acanthaster planci]|uniref:Alanine--glyoxylate aminotransferase 2, mitochondrial n=1 Tax=Acanthaster planci TaxID=133434 RepID=A0A8B7ZXG2_ACAPL|nr:alanine--glyoxylate aminotransferase 2, mitochondrial-like [Acanthaster planci]XP_022110099.1 alanine--glyoxylate aminotransferase 2, mitochondrial-like [Acanthaster planci]